MSVFKKGQNIVCIDDSKGKMTGLKLLKKDNIYTVRGIRNYEDGYTGVFLEELADGKDWCVKRFRPLIDESFGERICAEITEQVKQEQLIEA